MRKFRIFVIVFLLALVFTLASCAKNADKPIEQTNKPTVKHEKIVKFNLNGEIIKSVKVNKYKEAIDDFVHINNLHKDKDNFLGMYVLNNKVDKTFLENDDEIVLTDLYGNEKSKRLNKTKDITFFIKYSNKDWVYKYTYDDGVSITKDIQNDRKYNIEVSNIPDKINGNTVLELGSELFMSRKIKKGLILPSSIKRIAEAAFASASIENIKLPTKLEYIGDFAFSGRWNREMVPTNMEKTEFIQSDRWIVHPNQYKDIKPFTLKIPKTVVHVGENSFESNPQIRQLIFEGDRIDVLKGIHSMPNLEYVKLPNQINQMGYFCDFPRGIRDFKMPYEIKRLVDEILSDNVFKYPGFMNNVGDIGELGRFDIIVDSKFLPVNSFYNNASLRKVTIKSGVKQISGFSGPNIEEIIFEEGIEYIGKNSFSGTKLKKIQFPDSLKYIDGAFNNNNQLTSINFGKGLLEIDHNKSFANSGFKNKNLLYKSNLPTNNGEAFTHTNRLKSLEFPLNLKRVNGFSFGKSLEKIDFLTNLESINGFSSTKIKLLNLTHLTKLKQLSGFNNIKTLNEAKLSDKLEKVDDFLNGSININALNLPNSISLINDSFNSLFRLKSIILPDSLEILDRSFQRNISLTNITIGKNLKESKSSFYDLINLENIKINSLNRIIQYNDGYLFNNENKTLYYAKELGSNFPQMLKTIDLFSIHGVNSNNTTVVFPNNIEKVNNTRFYHSNSMLDINLSFNKDHPFIKNTIFNNFEKEYMRNVSKISNISSLFSNVVKNQESIVSIDFNNFNKNIQIHASFKNRFKNLNQITIPKYFKNRYRLFEDDLYVKKVIFETGVETIYNSEFANAKSIEEIIIPNTVTTIQSNAFSTNVNKIKNIFIPNSVKNVGGGIFIDWNSSQTITIDYKNSRSLPGYNYDRNGNSTGWQTDLNGKLNNSGYRINGWDDRCKAIIKYQ